MKKVLVLFNGKAGLGTARSDIAKACKKYDLNARLVTLDEHAKRHIIKAKREGYSIVAAAGGDGTISSVAALVKEAKLTLGVIPIGTLNHFAKDLNIPITSDEAVQVIARGRSRLVDVGIVNDCLFINNSSIGLYPAAVQQRERLARLIGKWPAALIGLARALVKLRRYRVTLQVGHQELQRKTPFIFVGNNIYNLDNLGITNRKRLTGGKLCIYVVTTGSVWKLIRIFMHALLGRIDIERDFESFTAKKLGISTKRPQLSVAHDGEVTVLDTPLQYRIEPAALRVITPR